MGGASSCGRDDLFAGDLGVDDLAQLVLVVVPVLREVAFGLEVADDLPRELHFVRLDLGRHGLELVDRAHRAHFARVTQRVHHEAVLARLNRDEILAAVERDLADRRPSPPCPRA